MKDKRFVKVKKNIFTFIDGKQYPVDEYFYNKIFNLRKSATLMKCHIRNFKERIKVKESFIDDIFNKIKKDGHKTEAYLNVRQK